MTEPTPRQLEALLMIYRGKHATDRDPNRTRDAFARNHTSRMGGAVHRMVERMAEAGWLQWHESRMGRRWPTNKLTLAGLELLAARYDGLDGIEDRIAAQRVADAEAEAKEAAQVEEARERNIAAATARKAARAAEFRRIMQDYQIPIHLTDDQCRAVWMAIVEKEHDL